VCVPETLLGYHFIHQILGLLEGERRYILAQQL
jgi:hypothetical protein